MTPSSAFRLISRPAQPNTVGLLLSKLRCRVHQVSRRIVSLKSRSQESKYIGARCRAVLLYPALYLSSLGLLLSSDTPQRPRCSTIRTYSSSCTTSFTFPLRPMTGILAGRLRILMACNLGLLLQSMVNGLLQRSMLMSAILSPSNLKTASAMKPRACTSMVFSRTELILWTAQRK